MLGRGLSLSRARGGSSAPTLTSISQPFGMVAGGLTGIVLAGASLGSASSVSIAGVAATITGNTSTTVTVTTGAAGAAVACGAVTVTTPGGTATLPGSLGFTYMPSALTLLLVAGFGQSLSGSNVTGWNDNTANGFNFSQATGANQPTLNASGPNGNPAITIASTLSLGSTTALSSILSAAAHDVFVSLGNVSSFFGNSVSVGGFALSDTGNYFVQGTCQPSSTPDVGAYIYDGSNNPTPLIAAATNTPCLLRSRHSGGTLYASVNMGTEQSIAAGNIQVTSGTVRIGSTAVNRSVAGDIQGIAASNTSLSVGDAAVVATFFRRYGALY